MAIAKKNSRTVEDMAVKCGRSDTEKARLPRADDLEVLLFGPHVGGDSEMVEGFRDD
ncbi:MAG: hypothetical protein JOY58_09295 [Solirubrobacterales bacterium]|nr:hypothetical protein [Solirubrobacterales bacterium]